MGTFYRVLEEGKFVLRRRLIVFFVLLMPRLQSSRLIVFFVLFMPRLRNSRLIVFFVHLMVRLHNLLLGGWLRMIN